MSLHPHVTNWKKCWEKAVIQIFNTQIKPGYTQELLDRIVGPDTIEALDTIKELADAIGEDAHFIDTMNTAIQGLETNKQDKLVSGVNIKTINGDSVLGSGDLILSTSTYKDIPDTWDITHTMQALISSINNDSTATPGNSYLGTVYVTDLPNNLQQTELIINIIDQLNNTKTISFELTNASQHWEYVSVDGNLGEWQHWITKQSDWKQINSTADDYIKNKPQNLVYSKELDNVIDPVAHTPNISLSGSVITVTDNQGIQNSIDVLSATDELVQITVTTDVSGVSVEGLTINAYFNGSTTVSASATTDNHGMCVIKVPNGYAYKLVFPDIQECKSIEDVTHTASVNQRSVEVEYVAVPHNTETVTIILYDYLYDTYTPIPNTQVSVKIGSAATTQYTTDSNGEITFDVEIGTQYTVTAPVLERKYIKASGYVYTYTAERTVRVLNFLYRNYVSGLFIVAQDGEEYELDEWEAAVASEERDNSEAKLIKVVTDALVANNGVFGFEIDAMRNRSYRSETWLSQNVALNTIPLNGNSSSELYYYDGYSACEKILEECANRGLQSGAVELAHDATYALDGRTLLGFLGSVGQWQVLWSVRNDVDEILQSVRPNGTYLLSNFTGNKWTSTQQAATNAWLWGAAANGSLKYGRGSVVPLFAF